MTGDVAITSIIDLIQDCSTLGRTSKKAYFESVGVTDMSVKFESALATLNKSWCTNRKVELKLLYVKMYAKRVGCALGLCDMLVDALVMKPVKIDHASNIYVDVILGTQTNMGCIDIKGVLRLQVCNFNTRQDQDDKHCIVIKRLSMPLTCTT